MISIRVLTFRTYPAYPLPRMPLSPRLAVAVAVISAACSGGSPGTTTAPPTTSAPEPTTTVQQVARPYEMPYELEFTATLFDGSSFEGVDVARQDVLFWFWAPT